MRSSRLSAGLAVAMICAAPASALTLAIDIRVTPADPSGMEFSASRAGAPHQVRLSGQAPVTVDLTVSTDLREAPLYRDVFAGTLSVAALATLPEDARTRNAGAWGSAFVNWDYLHDRGPAEGVKLRVRPDEFLHRAVSIKDRRAAAVASAYRSDCTGPAAQCAAYVSHYGPLTTRRIEVSGDLGGVELPFPPFREGDVAYGREARYALNLIPRDLGVFTAADPAVAQSRASLGELSVSYVHTVSEIAIAAAVALTLALGGVLLLLRRARRAKALN